MGGGPQRLLACVLCAAIAAVTFARAAPRASQAGLDALLQATGRYLAQSDDDVSGIVAEENYVQTAAPDRRRLRSDLVVTTDPRVGLVEFRDVIEVDGKPVADRRNRIETLLSTPGQDPLAEAKRLTDESARFNLNAPGAPRIDRTVNLPRLALQFLRAVNQRRSRFAAAGTAQVGQTLAAIVELQEQVKPRIIQSVNNAAARGRFWIDPEDGRILRTEMALETPISMSSRIMVAASVRVDFVIDPRLHLSVPATMDETYEIYSSNTPARFDIDGHATYSNVRRFQAVGRIVQ
jgi:hypothetical protein